MDTGNGPRDGVFCVFFFANSLSKAMSTSRSNCNRDLCRRHIPVVVNAIERLQQNQNDQPERQPYVASFSLTGEDVSSINGSFQKTGDAVYMYVFPQRYAAIFNAATADPNILIHIRLILTDEDGVSVSENMTANASTSAISPGYAKANYYPDNGIVQSIITKQQEEPKPSMTTIVTDQLKNLKGNEDTSGKLKSLSTHALYGTIPYIVTNGQALTLAFYFLDDLLRKLKEKSIMNLTNLPPMVNRDDESYAENAQALLKYIGEHVTLNVFEVSGIYVPPNP